jgi:pimeloyl-ACP methyl ester carboxylesterase
MRLAQRVALKYLQVKFRLLSSLSKRKAAEKAFQLFCTPQTRNKKKLPPVFEKAEKLSFQLGADTVRGYRWNAPSEKKVLIAHGFESSVINFDRYVKPLIRKGYEVLAFDAPAHGRSSGRKIDAAVYRDMFIHIYNNYGPVDSFIAHSFGGLCLSLALEALQPSNSCRLVLIAPAVETTRAIDNFFDFLKLNAGVRKEFDEIIREISGHEPSWFSIARCAPHLKAQVLFLQDRDDHMTPISDVEPIMVKNYSNFHFVISEGLGHRRIYRDNESLKTILEFL